MTENKEVMARNLIRLLKEKEKTATDLCRDLNYKQNTFSDWINAKTYPRIDRIEEMAAYFGVPKSALVEENEYYLDPETAKEAQRVFSDPNTRLLFDAAKNSKPENIRLAAEMLQRFKETNPNG